MNKQDGIRKLWKDIQIIKKKKAKKSYLEFVEVDSGSGTHFKSSVCITSQLYFL